MGVYYIIYMLILMVSVLLYAKDFNKQKAKKIICIVAFVSLFLMFALRHPRMGIDLGYRQSNGYLASFSTIARFSWFDAFQNKVMHYERGYILFNKLVSVFSENQQFFLAVSAFVTLLPIVYVIFKDCDYPDLAIYVYIGLPSFMMTYSGVRQAIAISICFLALMYIINKKPIKFILTVLLAMTFHDSAWIFLLAYPVYYLPMNRSRRMYSYLAIPFVYVFRYQLFSVFHVLFKEEMAPDYNNAFTLFFIFSLVYVFCGIFSDESERTAGLKNIFFVGCGIQALGGVQSTVMRVGYYFMNALILLLPLLVAKMQNRQNARIIKIVVSICFILFGLYSIRRGSWSKSYPYDWFWH